MRPPQPIGQAMATLRPDAPLPMGAARLSDFVKAPPALNKRLSTIGVIDRNDGRGARISLAPGQILVSREGDVWRWDGFTAHADAKTAAAVRLEQRNRLAVLDQDLESAQARVENTRTEHQTAQEALKTHQQVEREAREALSTARKAVDSARNALNQMEREYERANARITAIDETLGRLNDDVREHEETLRALNLERDELPDSAALSDALATSRDELSQARAPRERSARPA